MLNSMSNFINMFQCDDHSGLRFVSILLTSIVHLISTILSYTMYCIVYTCTLYTFSLSSHLVYQVLDVLARPDQL